MRGGMNSTGNMTRCVLPSCQVVTVVQEGWSGIKNGKLPALEAGRFDALITTPSSRLTRPRRTSRT